MLTRTEFVDFVLKGAHKPKRAANAVHGAPLPEGFEGFETVAVAAQDPSEGGSDTFARRLLEASGFGYAELVQRERLIRTADRVAKYLPDRVAYWPKSASRPYQTLLFETDLTSSQLLQIPAFRNTELNHLGDLEGALARLVSEALDGFQKGGESVTADVRQGRKEETLCIVSILDERHGTATRLVCFGTQSRKTQGLETFLIAEQTRNWELQLAREHLGLLYDRQFKKLAGTDWQDAFTTTDERKQAEHLLQVCTTKNPSEKKIQESILDLLDTIAKGFGFEKPSPASRRLTAYDLPDDHDIGIDADERARKFGGKNPFSGVSLRDGARRLLGYIVYSLTSHVQAAKLREFLSTHNRFHNVLVVYPDINQASLELWQGTEPLVGKLRKGQGYKDAADVVNLLSRFFVVSRAKICNPTELAQELAYRARFLRALAEKQLKEESDDEHLRSLFVAFRDSLLPELSEKDFADLYAQTLTYGLLSARWVSREVYAASGERFTRASALKHMPTTSPFLKEFFQKVLEAGFEYKLAWLLDDIADLLDRVSISLVFDEGDLNEGDSSDPVIHFYEPFLNEYDPAAKQTRGVFYTADAIVSFMVRSVDERVRTTLGLPLGLADTTSWSDYSRAHDVTLPPGISPETEFVSILDPAVGTGTFLKHAILTIYQTLVDFWRRQGKLEGETGELWNNYVLEHLVKRVHGMELMAAAYAICHLKLALTLRQTGFKGPLPTLNVRLTNSLREAEDTPQIGLFESMLTHEASAAAALKRGTTVVTIIIGNPPYRSLSANLFKGAKQLVERYRQISGQKIKEKGALQLERNLQDDYVKFMALSQSILLGVQACVWCFVTNHGFVDGPSLSGLRYALLEDFPTLSILNLNGNVNRGDIAPEGLKDENVFPIADAGVAILIGVRAPADVDSSERHSRYADLWGLKKDKMKFLATGTEASVDWRPTSARAPNFFLNEVASDLGDEYASFWAIDKVFVEYSNSIVTARDGLVIDFDKESLLKRIREFARRPGTQEEVCSAMGVSLKKGWNVAAARAALRQALAKKQNWVFECLYRPFDIVDLYYHPAVIQTMTSTSWHMLAGDNQAVLVPRTLKGGGFQHVMVTKHIAEAICLSTRTSVNGNCFPLWLYPDAKKRVLRRRKLQSGRLRVGAAAKKAPNLREEFLLALQSGATDKPSPVEAFHYLCSIFHSQGYRTRYRSRIGVEFPRIPIPKDARLVAELSLIGAQLADLYDLKRPSQTDSVRLNGPGEGEITRADFDPQQQCVWINDTQFLTPITSGEWNFQVGDYHAIERWLVGGRAITRKGRRLVPADLKRLSAMVESIRQLLMLTAKIDEAIEKHGGWPSAFGTTED